MTKLRRSLFIGLGGTGMKTILKTKKVLLDNFGIDGDLPPMLAFLGIDTDNNEYTNTETLKNGKVIRLTAREELNISVNNPMAYYEQNKRNMGWLSIKNINNIYSLDGRGAGQMRTNGRLAFMYNLSLIRQKIEAALDEVTSTDAHDSRWDDFEALDMVTANETKATIDVHIVFSLCGGSGAGTFLDIAYLVREIAELSSKTITINGYGVLPGVFDSQIQDLSAKARIKPNAYGALRDLDYLMSLIKPGTHGVRIPWQRKATTLPPFDSLTLVDNENTAGMCYRDIRNLTEMLSLALLSTTGQIGANLNSLGSNVRDQIAGGTFNVEDKVAWVSAVGASSIVYNSSRIAQVYSWKAQNHILGKLLTNVEDTNVIANTWINNAGIRENENKDQVIDRLFDMGQLTAPSLSENEFNKHDVADKINKKMGIYYKNNQRSNEDWCSVVEDFYKDVAGQLVTKIQELGGESLKMADKFLEEIARQIKDSFMVEMDKELKLMEKDREDAETNLNTFIDQLEKYLNDTWPIIKKKTPNYVSLIKGQAQAYLIADTEAKRRSFAITFYSKMLTLIESERKHLKDIMDVLTAIKKDNEVLISETQNGTESTETVIIDLASDEILNVTITDPESIVIGEFIKVLPHKSIYVKEERNAYEEALKVYTESLAAYKSIIAQTIDDILDAMDQSEFETLIKRAQNLSKPFLKINDRGIKLVETGEAIGVSEAYYVCVPNIKTNRLTKDGRYFKDLIASTKATPVSLGGITDRIIIYRQKMPIPILALANLANWEIPYTRLSSKSCHIDEDMLHMMEDESFSFMPKRDNLDEAVIAWTMGCILGRIKFERGVYWFQDDTVEEIGDAEEHWVSTRTAYRDEAFAEFCQREGIFHQYIELFREHIRKIGELKAAELKEDVKKNYFTKYSRCPLTEATINNGREYQATKQLISDEKKCRELIFTY